MNRILRTKAEVAYRLAELGLPETLLREAVSVGIVGWLSCTQNHPASFSGIYAWAETIRALRDRLLLLGWERLNDRNLPLTVNPATKVAITASSGDECTGIENLNPRSRNSKGNATRELATSNALQLGLFADMTESPEALVEEAENWDTWLLLSYRDLRAQTVRYELSRPINIGVDGRVDGWNERIILGEIPFDDDQFSLVTSGVSGGRNSDGSAQLDRQSDIVDVPVRRKA
jgi:hypothetical protein